MNNINPTRIRRASRNRSSQALRRLGRALIALAQAQAEAEAQAQATASAGQDESSIAEPKRRQPPVAKRPGDAG